MVRRDVVVCLSASLGEIATACCASSAGANPVPVSIGAPGSRPQAVKGDLQTQAGYQKSVRWREPLSGERTRGPQREVKPAASTHLQPGGRAAHITAKAISEGRVPKLLSGTGGYGAQHACQEKRGTRETRLHGHGRGKVVRISRWRRRTLCSGSPRGS